MHVGVFTPRLHHDPLVCGTLVRSFLIEYKFPALSSFINFLINMHMAIKMLSHEVSVTACSTGTIFLQ